MNYRLKPTNHFSIGDGHIYSTHNDIYPPQSPICSSSTHHSLTLMVGSDCIYANANVVSRNNDINNTQVKSESQTEHQSDVYVKILNEIETIPSQSPHMELTVAMRNRCPPPIWPGREDDSDTESENDDSTSKISSSSAKNGNDINQWRKTA